MDTATFENMVTDTQRIVCPVSEDREYTLATGYEKHYTTAEELRSNGGVCAECRKRFERRNSGILHGTAETPAEFIPRREISLDQDHAAFECPGDDPSAITEFDFAAVDEALGFIHQESEDVRSSAAALFASLMVWVWRAGKSDFRSAAMRFAVITGGIRPDLIADRTYREIAREFGVTKASISKLALGFQDKFKIKFSRSRSAESRRHMAISQIGHPAYQKKTHKTPPA